MTTSLDYPEHRIVLDNISWDLYESLLFAHSNQSVPRFTYDRGFLEIMSPSAKHEELKDAITQLVQIAAEEKRINVKGYGSTTFRREKLARGFEPDVCFYGANLPRVQGKDSLDLSIDPPPDLVIEIDISSSSLDKLSITADMGVPELWRYEQSEWRIFILQNAKYVEQVESSILPGLTSALICELIDESRTLEPLRWIDRLRLRIQRGNAGSKEVR